MTLQELVKRIREFNAARDWDQFHSPKNLAMALSVEVAEVVELFQWLTEEQSGDLPPGKRQQLEAEIGDVLICLLMLADKCGVDPVAAAERKIVTNDAKYPVMKCKGSAAKYTEL